MVLIKNKDFSRFVTQHKILEEIKHKIIIRGAVFDIRIPAWSQNIEMSFSEENHSWKPRLGTCGISVSLVDSYDFFQVCGPHISVEKFREVLVLF